MLTCLLPLSDARGAGAGELQRLTRDLQRAGHALQTLSATFVQRKQLKLFRSAVTTRGRLLYQRPDRLRWETFAPDASVVLVRGQRAELRLPGERPRSLDLRRDPALGALIEQVLVWMGARRATDLSRWYEIAIQRAATETRIQLVPRAPQIKRRVARLEVWLDDQLRLQRIQIAHPGGDQTRLTFTQHIVNKPLPETSWR